MVTGNIYASNAIQTNNIVAAGFTSNISNTTFNYSTLTVPFISSSTLNVSSTSNISATYATTLNVSSTSNISATYATTLNVSSTSNFASVVSSGQVLAGGKSNVGVCAPIVYRQGGSSTNWNISGTFTTTYAITSGAVQIQFGSNTMTTTTQTITYPVSYTNFPIVFLSGATASANALYISSVSATTAVVSGGSSGAAYYWQSIGI